MSERQKRERTFAWCDPAELQQLARSTSGGLAVMQKLFSGELQRPPILELLEIAGGEVEPGRISFVMQPREYMYNYLGTIHGGAIATLLDTALGCAVQTMLPEGKAYTSLDLQVRFLRALTLESGSLIAVGKTVHVGRRTASAEATLHDAHGKLCATGSSSCLIFD